MLEFLANELILDVFEYLDFVDLLRAFHQLNLRLDQLVHLQLRRRHLDLRRVSKRDYQQICRQYLPLLADRVASLRFPHDQGVPDSPQALLTQSYQVTRFTGLRSLSISYNNFDTLTSIIRECRPLTHLTRLRVHTSNHDYATHACDELISVIWSLPRLTHCRIDIRYSSSAHFNSISTVSTSIVHLVTKHTSYDLNTFVNLLVHTPNLQRLEIGELEDYVSVPLQVTFPSLTALSVSLKLSVDSTKHLLQLVPNLRRLTVQLANHRLDGHVWEQILSAHGKCLHDFRMVMNAQLASDQNNQFAWIDPSKQFEQLFNSFRSPFWTMKHQWFVRYDLFVTRGSTSARLYTLPYPLDKFFFIGGCQSRSTGPNDINLSYYNRVRSLEHTPSEINPCSDPFFMPIRCVRVRHLTIRFPLSDYFSSVVPTLDELISLDVTLNSESDYAQLQTLLDRAPRLHLLKFCQRHNFCTTPFTLRSPSVRRLELFQESGFRLRYLSDYQCVQLAGSPLATRCETLFVDLESRMEIVALVRAMPYLQVLNAHCRDSLKNRHAPFAHNADDDDLTTWLYDHLPREYSYTIARKGYTNIPLISVSIDRK